MTDEWHPSQYKPSGGRRPLWIVLGLVAACGAGWLVATKVFGWSGEVSWSVARIGVGIVVLAIVSPQIFSGKATPKPGQFPTGTSRLGEPLPRDDRTPPR